MPLSRREGVKLFRLKEVEIDALRGGGRTLRVRPGNGQRCGSDPVDAGILQLEIEFVSSVNKWIGIRSPSQGRMDS